MPGEGQSVPADRRLIRASFCSHDFRGQPWFDVFYPSLDVVGRAELRAVKHALGISHVVLAVHYSYRVIEELTGLKPAAFERNMPPFLTCVEELIADGLKPIVYMATEEEADVWNGEMARRAAFLKPYAKDLIVSPDFEHFPRWRTATTSFAVLELRRGLGDDVLIMIHGEPVGGGDSRFTPASFHGEGFERDTPKGMAWKDYRDSRRPGIGGYVEDDDPSGGDEIGWYETAAGREVDVVAWQSRHGRSGPSFNNDPTLTEWRGRWIEGWERFAPADTTNYLGNRVRTAPILGEAKPAPDWFGASRKRGRPILVPLELGCYEYAQRQISEARVREYTTLVKQTGCETFGSGLL